MPMGFSPVLLWHGCRTVAMLIPPLNQGSMIKACSPESMSLDLPDLCVKFSHSFHFIFMNVGSVPSIQSVSLAHSCKLLFNGMFFLSCGSYNLFQLCGWVLQ